MDKDILTSAEAMEAAVLPDAGAVHCDPGAPKTAEQQPLPKKLKEKPVEEKSPAEWAYERIILYIKNFEDQLDAEHEVAMGFTGSDAGVMRIEGMGFFAPDIITFYGTDPAGIKSQLIQHVSQLSVTLRALPKQVPDQPAQRIGFRLAADLEDGDA
ncbi:DUF6173 family protein [Alterinioella nitratireducens]|uniref:DUF6173 family protein n=1 Tax=Alterinioella nitratireducens TaxID=2735915 RepID=UPI0015570083|nr:DUF6173 family protein [Alterinioella nitratireducens]NPD18464.1 hypothetical protein [Alterinioella nitratireducens]